MRLNMYAATCSLLVFASQASSLTAFNSEMNNLAQSYDHEFVHDLAQTYGPAVANPAEEAHLKAGLTAKVQAELWKKEAEKELHQLHDVNSIAANKDSLVNEVKDKLASTKLLPKAVDIAKQKEQDNKKKQASKISTMKAK